MSKNSEPMRLMPARVLKKGNIDNFIKKLTKDYTVYGPVLRRSDVSFQEVASAEELKLDYTTTTISPKKYFHHRESLFIYSEGGFREVDSLEKQSLILGVHPCDLNAILRLDRLFAKDFKDSYYLRRRKNSAIIALSCTDVGENCFCASLGTGPSIREGFDLLLTDVGDGYLVELGSSKGERMIEGLDLLEASHSDFGEKERRIEAALSKFKKRMSMRGLDELASSSIDHEVWTLIGEKGGLAGCFACLSCGNCSLVCPTCYCFEVADVSNLSLNTGIRQRELDSCQLLEYAEVALGGNFRPDRRTRIRNWMTCKFGGAGGQIDSSCVGCGRCIRSCPARIDITEVAKMLRGE